MMYPQYPEGWNGKGISHDQLGWVLNSLNIYEEAIYCFDEAIRID